MKSSQNIWRGALGAALVVVLGAGVGAPSVTPRAVADTTVEAADATRPFSLISPFAGQTPSISGNGQFVVFAAAPSTEDGRTSTVWLSDRTSDEVVELSAPREGIRLGNTVNPVISADGCIVVATTEFAYDVFRDDDQNGRWDVYRTVLPACGGVLNEWTLVSISRTDGQAAARGDVDPTQRAALSSGGSIIAYVRPFEALSGHVDPARTPMAIDIADLTIPIDDPGHTTLAPGMPSELAGNAIDYAGQNSPALSADGNTVVFSSDASSNDAVADWVAPLEGATTVPTQVFAWDRSDADPFTAVQLISATADGVGDNHSSSPVVSGDGRVIAFVSTATNLVDAPELTICGAACPRQIYVAEREIVENADDPLAPPTITSSLSIVSRRSGDGGATVVGNGPSFGPSISGDGATVVFTTQAVNLFQLRTPGGGDIADGDVAIADLATDTVRRAFDTATPVPNVHRSAQISANGRALVADSLAAGQLIGDPAVVGRRVVLATYLPQLSIAALDVGTVAVSVPGPEWEANVINQGPGAFLPAEISIDNPDFAITGGSCFDLAPVAPGQSCGVKVLLTPSAPGARKATLSIAEAGYGAITMTAQIKGAGGEPALEAYPAAADLGSAIVGERSKTVAAFDVINVYIAPTAVTAVRIEGAHPDDFEVSDEGCAAAVQIASRCSMEVSFTPTGSGRRTATISVSTSLGQYTSILVAGEGTYKAAVFAAPSVKPGQMLGVGGSGYPADTDVTIGFSDGAIRGVVVRTDANGGFLTNVFIHNGTRSGATTLTAQAADGPAASTPVAIERVPTRNPASPTWPTRPQRRP